MCNMDDDELAKLWNLDGDSNESNDSGDNNKDDSAGKNSNGKNGAVAQPTFEKVE